MKPFLFFFFVFQLSLSSCDLKKFAAGSYPYAERIKFDCPSDTIINRLISLKATGRYNDAASFADGPDLENLRWYDFYFFSHENNFLLHLNVTTRTATTATLLLISIKDFRTGGQWQEINRGVSEKKQREVLAWFDKAIRPALNCRKQ